jgi:hypothetical protein
MLKVELREEHHSWKQTSARRIRRKVLAMAASTPTISNSIVSSFISIISMRNFYPHTHVNKQHYLWGKDQKNRRKEGGKEIRKKTDEYLFEFDKAPCILFIFIRSRKLRAPNLQDMTCHDSIDRRRRGGLTMKGNKHEGKHWVKRSLSSLTFEM